MKLSYHKIKNKKFDPQKNKTRNDYNLNHNISFFFIIIEKKWTVDKHNYYIYQ